MRPRRGPDTRPQEPKTRVNEAIRVPRVRLIDVEGEQVGLKTRDEALEYAWSKNLDLVEVAPDANPPVCRVMDYSKYKYEQEQKQKLARKHQSTITIKEIKLRPKIDPHDYETKKGHVLRFLRSRDKVKVTIMFRGREMYHPERGRSLLLRLAEDVKDLAMIESDPLQDGRNMVMMLAPHKEAVAVKPASEGGEEESGAASAGTTSENAPSEVAPAAEAAPEGDEAAPEAVAPEAASPEPESEPEVEAETQAETPVTPA
jgi:translation initiation factor IF-3